MEQKNKKGICRDREDLLEDEGGKEGGKGIIPFATKMLVKSVIKDRRDKSERSKCSSRSWKKEGVSSMNISLQSEKISFKEI